MAFDFPDSPTEGQVYQPTGGPRYVFSGGRWGFTPTNKSQALISDEPPVNPVHGDLWWESDTGNLYTYYDDGDSQQWVQINVGPSSLSIFDTKDTIFTASGPFTPDPLMSFCEVSAWGGGGAGGGGAASASVSIGGGGCGGAYSYRRLSKLQVGASQAVVIGTGGVGTAAAGGAGAATTFGGFLVSAAGGAGGGQAGPSTGTFYATTGSPTQSVYGDVRGWTVPGTLGAIGSANAVPGTGGNTIWGGAGIGSQIAIATGVAGLAAAVNTGSGGGGAAGGTNSTARLGGNGGSGLLIVKEYLRAA
jgi:hypothetical protein